MKFIELLMQNSHIESEKKEKSLLKLFNLDRKKNVTHQTVNFIKTPFQKCIVHSMSKRPFFF